MTAERFDNIWWTMKGCAFRYLPKMGIAERSSAFADVDLEADRSIYEVLWVPRTCFWLVLVSLQLQNLIKNLSYLSMSPDMAPWWDSQVRASATCTYRVPAHRCILGAASGIDLRVFSGVAILSKSCFFLVPAIGMFGYTALQASRPKKYPKNDCTYSWVACSILQIL